MDCRTAEGMVSSYIKHDLPLNELEEFLDHVQNCSSCYDELETYFIVHEVTQQLDDDSSDSVLDFKKLLEQDIRKSRRYIRKKKASWLMFGVSICLLIATIAAILIFVMMETTQYSEQSFLWSAGSYKFRRKTHRGSIWFPEYPSSDDRGREASVSDSGI